MVKSDFIRQMPGSATAFGKRLPLAMRLHIDLPLLAILLLLAAFGLTVLYSASGRQFGSVLRQAAYLLCGMLAMFGCAQINLKTVQRWAPWGYLGGVLLLFAVDAAGIGAKGAQRWLQIPGLPRFQPSEIMKLLVPLAVASFLSTAKIPPRFKQIFVAVVIVVVPVALVVVQPDLGTGMLITAGGLIVLFLGGLGWRYVIIVVLVVATAAPIMWKLVLYDYQKQRILTLLHPETDKLGAGWNIIQSKTAIGSGGIEGKGWLQGTQSHLDYLPEGHTDFIIAVLAEEFGFQGVLLLLGLYLLLLGRALWIAMRAQERFSRLVCGGLALTFFVYIVVNMGMVSGLLPIVGVPLPLVSQGGTAVVSLLSGFGFIMAVATERRRLLA